MTLAFEKRPVIGMIALMWAGLAVGAVAANTTGIPQLIAILAFGALAVGYRTIEGRSTSRRGSRS
jgi:hypothetical protein